MRLTLVDDKKIKTIIRNQEDMQRIMALTLEALETILDQTKANLVEANALKEFLGDADPTRAVAKLNDILAISRRLADIVPNDE